MDNLPFPKTLAAVPRWVYDMHQRVNRSIGGERLANLAPKFSTVVKMMKTDSKKEAFFIKSILQTHPGLRVADTAYTRALRTFLSIMTGKTPKVNFRSRRQVLQWFKIQYEGH